MQDKKKNPTKQTKTKTKRIFVEKIHVNIYFIYKDENIIQLGL